MFLLHTQELVVTAFFVKLLAIRANRTIFLIFKILFQCDHLTINAACLPSDVYLNPFTPKSAKFKTEEEIVNFVLQDCQKQTGPLECTAR